MNLEKFLSNGILIRNYQFIFEVIKMEETVITKTSNTFVFVHGGNMSTDTWNKLANRDDYLPGGKLGGKIWNTLIPALNANNYRFYTPTLIDEYETNLTGHIKQICNIIIENDLKDVILVGHSYGGMVITGVAAKMPEKIKQMIYLDAAVPKSGQSLFDLFKEGDVDPLSFVGLEPAPAYVEKLYFDAQKIQKIPKNYILCTKSEFAVVTNVSRKRVDESPQEWTYVEIPASHVPMADMPEEFSKLLLGSAEK